ncbi:PASTA domain-containing protein [Gordonia hankookensis]|uniref:PASTA domain-containing protein n=2 Tax=Gordonia hankookensis TaxID=589403 RepID=A0ABR7WCK3_9ACTN|nr:PASTA domain-containing protein [Gordonia hankookensis]
MTHVRKSAGAAAGALLIALAIAGCGGGGDAATTTVTETTTAAETAETDVSTTEPPTTEAPPTMTQATATTAPAEDAAIMPDVVCMNLQDAQNKIQDAGVFFSRSTDATGQGRSQILDRNWIVVAQTPDPGTPIGEGDAVLSAVKIGESDSC